ncbi:hypothetical protein AB0D11_27170 [Streptomyces monashensis]|uniref:hypothetical protein n=1 Tax=Streptomyces monashensis TaxID=1678012 RepID=UPI0033CB54BE
MLGASNGQGSKWNVTSGNHIQAAELVTVQEAGPTPPGDYQDSVAVQGPPRVGRAWFVQHHRWRYRGGAYEVHFLQADRKGGHYAGGRDNDAIVRHRVPDQASALPGSAADGQAALGARRGDDGYFTLHARPTGRRNPANEPGGFALPAGTHLYNTGLPTQDNGRVLQSSRDREHAGRGRTGGTGRGVVNGMPAFTNRRDEGFCQRWDIEGNGTDTVRFRLPKARCLMGLLDRKGHGKAVMFDCGLTGLARWRLLTFGNKQYQVRSIPLGLCLDVGTSTNPRDVSNLELNPCKAKAGQHWYRAPRPTPTSSPISTGTT